MCWAWTRWTLKRSQRPGRALPSDCSTSWTSPRLRSRHSSGACWRRRAGAARVAPSEPWHRPAPPSSRCSLSYRHRARVYQYYLPTYLWVLRQLEAHRASHSGPGEPPALVVRFLPVCDLSRSHSTPQTLPTLRVPPQLGISAPQGCGKTTLVSSLQRLFNEEGRACASVSLDDFYLTGEAQDALAAANPDNELLRYRGNAGTHDLELAEHTLSALRSLQQPGATAAVPFYDKSLRAGRGDRAPAQDWPTVAAPVQLVLFEGWSLGFSPLADDQAAAAVNPNLAAVNSKLRAYAGAMERFCDAWVMIRVANPGWCFQWRLQAELQMRAAGKPGLTDAQVSDFVQRFMPAYEAYLPALYATGPSGRPGRPLLALDIDAARQLTGAV